MNLYSGWRRQKRGGKGYLRNPIWSRDRRRLYKEYDPVSLLPKYSGIWNILDTSIGMYVLGIKMTLNNAKMQSPIHDQTSLIRFIPNPHLLWFMTKRDYLYLLNYENKKRWGERGVLKRHWYELLSSFRSLQRSKNWGWSNVFISPHFL